jgi:hypothetical protein
VGGVYKELLMKIIQKDSEFFKKCEIIDYSLLVGVHERKLHETVKNAVDNN